MQQSNPNAKFVWHDSPYPSGCKAIQGQDKCSKAILMQCLSFFLHDLPYRSGWKTIQNQNKCSKKNLQCLFFCMTYPTEGGWKTIQNQNKYSKVILLQCLLLCFHGLPAQVDGTQSTYKDEILPTPLQQRCNKTILGLLCYLFFLFCVLVCLTVYCRITAWF